MNIPTKPWYTNLQRDYEEYLEKIVEYTNIADSQIVSAKIATFEFTLAKGTQLNHNEEHVEEAVTNIFSLGSLAKNCLGFSWQQYCKGLEIPLHDLGNISVNYLRVYRYFPILWKTTELDTLKDWVKVTTLEQIVE